MTTKDIEQIELVISQKKKLISETRTEVKSLMNDLSVMLERHKEQQAIDELEALASLFDDNWAGLIRSGLSVKEVLSLQNLNTKYKELGIMLGVCSSRASEIRSRAIRKMHHPCCRELAKHLGLYESLGIDKWVAERVERDERRKNRPLYTIAEISKPYKERERHRALVEQEMKVSNPLAHALLFPESPAYA